MADTSLDRVLAEFVAREGSGPKQGTEEWLRARFWSIGGASIATYLGENQYNSPLSEIEARLPGRAAQPSTLPMRWGNLFEPLARAVTEMEWSTSIVGSDMMIRYRPGCHYSPDGFSITPVRGEEPEIVLHEFKCVWSRALGEMPRYYIPQVMMGLCVSPATVGLFSQFQFCILPIGGMERPGETLPAIRKSREVEVGRKLATHCGVIYFPIPLTTEISIGPGADIGAMHIVAANVLTEVMAATSGAIYGPVHPFTPAGIAEMLIAHRAHIETTGPMPFAAWRLTHHENYIIGKDPNFMPSAMTQLQPIIDTYQSCAALPATQPGRDACIRRRLLRLIRRKGWMPSVEKQEEFVWH